MAAEIMKLEATVSNLQPAGRSERMAAGEPEANKAADSRLADDTHVLLVESKLAALEEYVKHLAALLTGAVSSSPAAVPNNVESEKINKRLDQLNEGLDRCARICHMNWTNIGAMATKLQIVQDTSAIAMQQTTFLRTQQDR
eukprot:4954524-Amphidinium_carterae.1